MPTDSQRGGLPAPGHWGVTLAVAFLAVAAAAGAYLVFVAVPAGRAEALDDWGHRLVGMADDREAAVRRWADDLRADAQTLADYPTAQYILSDQTGPPYPFDPGVGPTAHLEDLFSRFTAVHDLRSAALFDARSRLVAAGGPAGLEVDSTASRVLQSAIREGARLELPGGEDPVLIAAAPVHDRAGEPLGAVLVRAEVRPFLFRLLQSQPVPSLTGETILVTRDGDEVVYISPLRKTDAPPGSLRRPLASEELAGAAAARGVAGRGEYVDYQGARVLAALRPIRGTPWALIAKADRDEVLADFRTELGRVVSAVLALVIGALGVAFGIWRWQRQRLASARRALEHQLQQSQKMEAVGRLAGGVAHDFNNILTSIQGHAALALEDLPPGDALADDLEEIARSAERASALTRQLLAFSRRQIFQPRVVDVGAIVEGMVPMLRRLIGEHIELEVSAEGDTPLTIRADPTQIEQVVMNLTVNARDAMPRGGTLRLEVRESVWPGGEPGAASGAPAVRLLVTDTGVGMDAETVDRIFEPFFTTKSPDQGTGLGLSTVYGIVEQSRGVIDVKSEPGRGTTFVLYFPAVPPEAHDGEASSAAGADAAPEPATVLVVEDEPGVRDLARRVLEKDGHRVLVARSGAEALERVRSLSEPVDLLLTDMVMPGIHGTDLARQLRETHPGCPVLLMSGYTEDALIRDQKLDGATAFIEKPFTPRELSRKVAECLARDRDDDAAGG